MNMVFDMNNENLNLEKCDELAQKGLVVLPGIFSEDITRKVKSQIFENKSLLKNTRSTENSLHLAGFHRYPEFENLHSLISCNKTVLGFLKKVVNGGVLRNIGITDITINRSQCWHKDLLRGSYKSFLDASTIWQAPGEVFRVLLYLQDSSSLKIVPGSHLKPISLESDDHAIPIEESNAESVHVRAGDIVVMDVRTTHRGASESECNSVKKNLGVLVATTLGSEGSLLADQLEIGNSYRLKDWMKRNKGSTV